MSSKGLYDVAIIGSGIGGSSLACILAKHGLKVIVFEQKSHPRFAIGESMILESSEMLRSLAMFYDVPEIAYYSSIKTARKTVNSYGVKKHFGFVRHTAGEVATDKDVLQAIIPDKPYGHEIHIFRQDSDYLLLQAAIKYGAIVKQNTPVEDVDLQRSKVTIKTAKQNYEAKFVVDGCNFGSIIRKKLDLHSKDMRTQARGLFTHMINVGEVEEGMELGSKLPWPMSEGTLHNLFDGGWSWIIPFNNHKESKNNLVSVGLLLDPDKYPANFKLEPETEFNNIINQYPSIQKQFANARSVMPWVNAPVAIQYQSKQSIGDRWALLASSNGFVDPLYSKGIYYSMVSVSLLAEYLLEANEKNSNLKKYQKTYTKVMQSYLRSNDDLVYYSYKSFSDPKMYRLYSVMWLSGAYNEYLKLTTNRAFSKDYKEFNQMLQKLRMVGGGYKEFDKLEKGIHNIMDKYIAGQNSSQEIDKLFDQGSQLIIQTSWVPGVFKDLLRGKNHLPRRKIRMDLFNRDSGFMKTGSYKKHFFQDKTMVDVIKFFAQESWDTMIDK